MVNWHRYELNITNKTRKKETTNTGEVFLCFCDLLGVVVDELPVDKDIDVVVADQINFVLHLLLLRQFDLRHLQGHHKINKSTNQQNMTNNKYEEPKWHEISLKYEIHHFNFEVEQTHPHS
jgi:hypothetical protein